MGLFDKKKKKPEEAKEDIKLEDADVSGNVDTSRRFSIVVGQVTTMLDGNGSIVSGQLYGKILKGDTVYIYQLGDRVMECQVQAIEAKQEEKSVITDEAENTSVSLQLNLPDDVLIKKFAVITNLKPQDKVDPKVSIENPALAGIVNGMVAYGKDKVFHSILAYWMTHGHFITPIKMDKEPQLNEKGQAVIAKDTKIGFYMLKSPVKFQGTPEDKESIVFPLFTDWDSLKKWSNLSKDGQRIHTQILSFQDVYKMIKKGDAYSGIVINPFNQVPCTLPIAYLDSVTAVPAYQNEFGAPDGSKPANVHEQKIAAGTKFLLGAAKDSDETKAIVEKLKEYGASHEEINSISFLVKVEDATKIARYLVVLEFTTKLEQEAMKVHMEAIFKELQPLAQEIKNIEYAIKGTIKGIDDLVAAHADQMLIYNK